MNSQKNENMKCSHGSHLLTIDCPYSQKFGLMCSMIHSDTISSKIWCAHALTKHTTSTGVYYDYCSNENCPYTIKHKIPCSMRHGP